MDLNGILWTQNSSSYQYHLQGLPYKNFRDVCQTFRKSQIQKAWLNCILRGSQGRLL